MVSEYGMGTELISRRLPPDDYSVSDATRRTLDEEQQHLTDLAYRRALAMILEHRELLDAFAAQLLDREVLERKDIEKIMARYRISVAERAIEQSENLNRGAGARIAASERLELEPPQ
jgi:ATP-dependent Zn protease